MNTFQVNKITIISSEHNTFKYNTECMICANELNDDSIYAQENNYFSQISTGSCGHSFHNDCIKEWLKNNNSCPLCKQRF